MSDLSLRGWPAFRAGWATMTRTIRVLVVLSVPLGLAALAAVAMEPLLSGDAALWAANIGWTLGGLVALTGTLAAGLRRERGSAVRGAWLLGTAAAAAGWPGRSTGTSWQPVCRVPRPRCCGSASRCWPSASTPGGVQSEPGRGTIIRVSLPLEQGPAGHASSGMSRSGGTGPEEPAAVQVAEQSPGGR